MAKGRIDYKAKTNHEVKTKKTTYLSIYQKIMMATIFLMDLPDKKAIGQQMDIIFSSHYMEGINTAEES